MTEETRYDVEKAERLIEALDELNNRQSHNTLRTEYGVHVITDRHDSFAPRSHRDTYKVTLLRAGKDEVLVFNAVKTVRHDVPSLSVDVETFRYHPTWYGGVMHEYESLRAIRQAKEEADQRERKEKRAAHEATRYAPLSDDDLT
jgi:hypothetical protein